MIGNNNQGIDHISRTTGGVPLCKNRNAYMSISIERYRADDGTGHYCRRCLASLAKMRREK
jgi:predicted Zn-dependent protease